jgi:hypothetical protein
MRRLRGVLGLGAVACLACAPLRNPVEDTGGVLVESAHEVALDTADLLAVGHAAAVDPTAGPRDRLLLLADHGGASLLSLGLGADGPRVPAQRHDDLSELGGGPVPMALVDLDGDGEHEVVFSARLDSAGVTRVFGLDGSDTFTSLDLGLGDAPDAIAAARLGAASERTLAMGLHEAEDGHGAVLLFPPGADSEPVWLVSDASGSAGPVRGMGKTLAAGGDTDGDGLRELAVGTALSGAVLVYTGEAQAGVDAASEHVVRRAAAPWTPLTMGEVLRFAGDVNGDGYDELLVADTTDAANGSADTEYIGEARLYYGTPAGLDADTEQRLYPQDGGARLFRFGLSATAGDLDGDGHSDITLLSAALEDEAEGELHVLLGGPEGALAAPRERLSWAESDQIRAGVVRALDLDGDGGRDLLLAQPGGTGEGVLALRWWRTGSQ